MKKSHIFFIYSVVQLCFLFSCTSASEDDLTVPLEVETVTYTENVKIIIDNNCTVCHNDPPINSAPMPLLTFTQVKQAVENRNLIGRITSDDPSFRMPLGGQPLPQNLIDIIIQWQADGLLE